MIINQNLGGMKIYSDVQVSDVQANYLKNFIHENYEIEYQNVKDINEAKYFMLCDVHDRVGYKKINSTFIDTFSQPSDMIMIEAEPSMQEIKAKESAQSCWLKTSTKIIGWDLDKIENFIGNDFSKCVRPDLLLKRDIAIGKLLDPNNKEDRSVLWEEAVDTGAKIVSIIRPPGLLERLKETFPPRVSAMIKSLNAVSGFADRVFLIAGTSHLIEIIKDERCSLKDFYNWIAEKKVVILRPKANKVYEAETPIHYIDLKYHLRHQGYI